MVSLFFVLAAALSFPAVSYATTFADVVTDNVFPVLDASISFIVVLTVLAFLFGVVRFMATAGDDQSRVAGKKIMVWGLIALFLMISVWGVVQLIKVMFFG